MPTTWWPRSLASCALMLGAGILASPTASHPHVRIKVEIAFEVRNGALVALRERWTFDEAFLKSNLEEFDKNKNGVFDPDELSSFRQLSIATMKRFGNFTAVWQGGSKAQIGEAVFTNFSMTAPNPIVEFRTALVKPVSLSQTVLVDVYDPTYYSAFQVAADVALTFDGDHSPACSARVDLPAEGSRQMKDYRAYIAAFGPMAARLVTPQTMALSCPAGPTSAAAEGPTRK